MERTRCTAGVLTTSRSLLELADARLNVRTSALTPAESQKVVLLMSATSRTAPWLTTESRSSRTWSAFVTSTSAGSVTTATGPIHSTG
jgi:hypothetical protein